MGDFKPGPIWPAPRPGFLVADALRLAVLALSVWRIPAEATGSLACTEYERLRRGTAQIRSERGISFGRAPIVVAQNYMMGTSIFDRFFSRVTLAAA